MGSGYVARGNPMISPRGPSFTARGSRARLDFPAGKVRPPAAVRPASLDVPSRHALGTITSRAVRLT